MSDVKFTAVLDASKMKQQLKDLFRENFKIKTGVDGKGNGGGGRRSGSGAGVGGVLGKILKSLGPLALLMKLKFVTDLLEILVGFIGLGILKYVKAISEIFTGSNFKLFKEGPNWVNLINPITWSNFVMGIDWAKFISKFKWKEFISKFDWSLFVPNLSWGDFIPSLSLQDVLDWLFPKTKKESSPKFGGGGFGGGGFTGGFGGGQTATERFFQQSMGDVSAASEAFFGAGEAAAGGPQSFINDGIITKNGKVIKTHPNDTIFASKSPGGMGGQKVFNFYGVTPREMIETIKNELGEDVNNHGRF